MIIPNNNLIKANTGYQLKMVHLARVSISEDLSKRADALALGVADDEFSTTVYGTRFAAMDLPKNEMPDNEMPSEVAYRMIK